MNRNQSNSDISTISSIISDDGIIHNYNKPSDYYIECIEHMEIIKKISLEVKTLKVEIINLKANVLKTNILIEKYNEHKLDANYDFLMSIFLIAIVYFISIAYLLSEKINFFN